MTGFHARSVRLSGKISAPGSIDRVFELFSPLGETLWVPGWAPEILHPHGASWEQGLIFRTAAERGDAIWLVTRLDRAAHEVEYCRVEPGRYVARVSVQCAPAGRAETTASITYEYVGLSETGNDDIAAMTEDGYDEKMARWRSWISDHLHRGA
jgi:hypothetical protein